MDQKYLSLKNVRITLDTGVVADATKISIKRKPTFEKRTSGGSPTAQQVLVEEDLPDITIEGWNSDNLAFADIQPGSAIAAFTVLGTDVATTSALQSDFFTKWPVAGMCIGETDTSLDDKPSKWTTKIECGVLNPGEF